VCVWQRIDINKSISRHDGGQGGQESYAMNLPSSEVCKQLIALHLLLGSQLSDEQRDLFRKQLLHLLAAHTLRWSDWPEFFEAQNIQPTQPLPPVGSAKWKKQCQKICQLHASMASTANEGSVACKKLLAEIAKQKFAWSSDLPAILAADWIHQNPTVAGTASAASTGMPDGFTLLDWLRALLDDYVVLSEGQRLVLALWALHTHVYDRFEYTPRLGVIAPDSGYGKTRIMRLLKQLVREPKLSKNITAAAIFRRLAYRPRATYLLDEAENQPILTDPVMRAVIDAGYERGGSIDRADGEFPVFFPCAYAVRGSEFDVPVSIRSRSVDLLPPKAVPKKRFDEDDPTCMVEFTAIYDAIAAWAARTTLNRDPEMPAPLLRDSRVADNCRPLLAVADSFSPQAGEVARLALIELCAGFRNLGSAHRALRACTLVCDALGEEIDRIDIKVLAEGVIQEDDYFVDWRGANDKSNPHKLTPPELSRLLKRFGLRSRPMWPIPRKKDSKSFRGYDIAKIYEAARTHLDENDTPTQASKIIALVKS
jgi:hypothetical protein